MKRSTRMMLMSGGRKDDRRYDREPEDKLRDRRGREHYDNGRYAPRSEMMEPEDRGYRRYSDGRFAPRNDGGMWVISIHAPREGCDSKLYQRAESLLGSICLFAQGEEG